MITKTFTGTAHICMYLNWLHMLYEPKSPLWATRFDLEEQSALGLLVSILQQIFIE